MPEHTTNLQIPDPERSITSLHFQIHDTLHENSIALKNKPLGQPEFNSLLQNFLRESLICTSKLANISLLAVDPDRKPSSLQPTVGALEKAQAPRLHISGSTTTKLFGRKPSSQLSNR